MQFDDFRRIVTCFADHVDDVDTSRGELLVQIRDETISARLHQRPEGLVVEEDDQRLRAESWLVNRVARVPLLAVTHLLVRVAAALLRQAVRKSPR